MELVIPAALHLIPRRYIAARRSKGEKKKKKGSGASYSFSGHGKEEKEGNLFFKGVRRRGR